MINTAAYSFASQAYPDSVEKVISLMEGIVGVGITVSPIAGSFVYEAVGFSTTFYIFGAAMAPMSFVILCFLDRPLNVKEKLAR